MNRKFLKQEEKARLTSRANALRNKLELSLRDSVSPHDRWQLNHFRLVITDFSKKHVDFKLKPTTSSAPTLSLAYIGGFQLSPSASNSDVQKAIIAALMRISEPPVMEVL